MRTPSISLVNDYARSVLSGKVVSCHWVKRACERHLDDLERSKTCEFPYKFDKSLATRAINFVELLPHTKGRWASKHEKLKLEPWQCFIIGSLFGWVGKEDGLRRFGEAYLEITRKQGKSVTAAGIGVLMMVADSEFGAEVYSGATTEKQAWEVFRPARLMVNRTPELANHYGVEVNAASLIRTEDFSKFEPLIGNPGDGTSPSCAIIDEFHEHKNADQYDTMMTGMGAREQPLMLVITTAGNDIAGPCYEKHLEITKILDGALDADNVFGIIYTLDEGDDWKDPEVWPKANPNLGVSVSRKYLEAQIQRAIRSPSKQSSVKTKHFNIWSGARSAFINMEQWAQAADKGLKIGDFSGDDGFVGLDMATRVDLSARLSLFWREIEGYRHYYAFPHFYLPEDALHSVKNADMYAGWADAGYIELMDGAETDFEDVQGDILALPDVMRLKELVYDPWQTTQIAQAVRKQGVTAVEYRNTVGNMSPPMRELEASLAGGRFHHPDNPVFNWCASNLVAKVDAKENVFPRKDLPENKIDGEVALLFAMGRAMVAEDTTRIYEKQGLTVI